MIEVNSYGQEADAAAIWASLQLSVTPKKMHAWKQFLFELFAIKSPDNSYRLILKILRNEAGAIEKLAEAVVDHPDCEELGYFVAAFLNPTWAKAQEEKARDEVKQNNFQEQIISKNSAIEQMNKNILGLEEVKEQIMGIVGVLKLRKACEEAGLKTGGLALHNTCLFIGPPGVGKTEIAQCFANVLFEENLLPGKNFLNINAAELKAQYIGHTIPKVVELFKNNDVIFLDEAYSLTASHNGEMDPFSKDAISQLCVELEKSARDKLIIIAGYGGDIKAENNMMQDFLSSNPGISSRITFHFNFPSYSPDQEMPKIFGLMAENDGWMLEEGWHDIAVDFFTARSEEDNYGNAREGRRLLQQAIVIHASSLDFSKVSANELKTLSCNGLKEAANRILKAEENLKGTGNNPIGFI